MKMKRADIRKAKRVFRQNKNNHVKHELLDDVIVTEQKAETTSEE